MAHVWRRALGGLTSIAYEMFRRLPRSTRRLLIRVLTPNYTIGVVAVCLDPERRVLLVRSRQHTGWALPGGLLRRGEDPLDGLAREISEELTISTRTADLAAGRIETLIDPVTQAVTVVVAVTLADRPRMDGTEVIEVAWFAEADLPARLVRGTRESLDLVGALRRPTAS